LLKASASYVDYERTSSLSINIKPKCGDGICEIGDCKEDCAIDVPDDSGDTSGDSSDDSGDSSGGSSGDSNRDVPGVGFPVCGDGDCHKEEDFIGCPRDCSAPICGNNKCELMENAFNCEADCKENRDVNEFSRYQLIKYLEDQIGEKDVSELAKECNSITKELLKDDCFHTLAKESDSVYLCKFIDQTSKRDDCYFTYAFKNNEYSECSKIEDPLLVDACDSSRLNYELQQAYS